MKYKQNVKSIIGISAAAIVMLGAGACSGGGSNDGGGRSNPSASQILNVAYFNGGVSVEWLKELEKEYETQNPDVEILINSELKDEIKNQKLLADIKNRNEDVFFTHEISYGEFVQRGLLEEITDIVKSPATTGEKTVEERMNENLRSVYNRDGHYYAVPFYTNFSGAIYDVDLFEEKELFIAKDGGYTSGVSDAKEKSLGKDGLPNTYDDGLPSTFDEYKTWLRYVKNRGVTPYIWCTDDSYRTLYLDSLRIGYDGVNDFELNSTFTGTMKNGTVITAENAYLLRQDNGRKFAVEMAKEIISNKYYHPDSVNGSITHTDAQNKFLRGRPDNKPIAMILEGGWWENEARSTFASIAKRSGDKYALGNRRFAYMPVPKYDENAEAGESLYCTSGSVAALINASSKQKKLAKDFLRFTLTNHAMSTFTKHVGISRPYEYTLEEGVYDSLTPFGKNFWDICTSQNSKIYYDKKGHPFKSNTNYFGTYEWNYGATLGGEKVTDPFLYFLNHKDVSAQEYMQGLAARYSAESYIKEYERWLATQK